MLLLDTKDNHKKKLINSIFYPPIINMRRNTVDW